MYVVLATLLATGLASCSQEEASQMVQEQNAPVEKMNFKVIDENEISGEELFADAISQVEGVADEELCKQIEQSYNQSYNEQPSLNGTRAIVPALYKTVRVEYETLDQDNKPVTCSALIVYPLLKRIKNVMLINHGTHIGFMLVPTKYTSVEGIMAATGSLCIMPDYIGLGSSAKHPDLYLNHEVHGRTSVDALLTLLDYAQAKKLPLESNYKTYILGYSQGGSVSLASLRRVQELDEATQKRLHLTKVFCGDGPYDLRRTFETYMEEYKEGKKMGMATVIPFVINSMFNSYPQEVAHMNYEDFFTAKALKTGVPQAIRANKEGIIDVMLKMLGNNLGDVLNLDYLEAHPDHLELLLSLMDRQNLCHGWSPKYTVKLMHSNPDGVVPFSNFLEATKGLQNEHLETQVLNINTKILSEPLLQHINGMLVMIEEVLSGNF